MPSSAGRPAGGAGEPPAGERLPRAARIRREDDIRRAVGSGRRQLRGPLEVYRAPSPAGRPRFAVVVPLHGHGTVDRNLLRRRIRELLRTRWLPDAWDRGDPVDLVVRTRPRAYDLSYSRLETLLQQALDDGA